MYAKKNRHSKGKEINFEMKKILSKLRHLKIKAICSQDDRKIKCVRGTKIQFRKKFRINSK